MPQFCQNQATVHHERVLDMVQWYLDVLLSVAIDQSLPIASHTLPACRLMQEQQTHAQHKIISSAETVKQDMVQALLFEMHCLQQENTNLRYCLEDWITERVLDDACFEHVSMDEDELEKSLHKNTLPSISVPESLQQNLDAIATFCNSRLHDENVSIYYFGSKFERLCSDALGAIRTFVANASDLIKTTHEYQDRAVKHFKSATFKMVELNKQLKNQCELHSAQVKQLHVDCRMLAEKLEQSESLLQRLAQENSLYRHDLHKSKPPKTCNQKENLQTMNNTTVSTTRSRKFTPSPSPAMRILSRSLTPLAQMKRPMSAPISSQNQTNIASLPQRTESQLELQIPATGLKAPKSIHARLHLNLEKIRACETPIAKTSNAKISIPFVEENHSTL